MHARSRAVTLALLSALMLALAATPALAVEETSACFAADADGISDYAFTGLAGGMVAGGGVTDEFFLTGDTANFAFSLRGNGDKLSGTGRAVLVDCEIRILTLTSLYVDEGESANRAYATGTADVNGTVEDFALYVEDGDRSGGTGDHFALETETARIGNRVNHGSLIVRD